VGSFGIGRCRSPIAAYPGCPGKKAVKQVFLNQCCNHQAEVPVCMRLDVNCEQVKSEHTRKESSAGDLRDDDAVVEGESREKLEQLVKRLQNEVVVCRCLCDFCTSLHYVKKVKFSHTRYQALGPELILVYRQSARR